MGKKLARALFVMTALSLAACLLFYSYMEGENRTAERPGESSCLQYEGEAGEARADCKQKEAEEEAEAVYKEAETDSAYRQAVMGKYEYRGFPFVEVNGNIPFFDEADFTQVSFEEYSPLDPLGRCGAAFANIGTDLMPVKEREPISEIRPSGWHSIQYKGIIEDDNLYHRCHLIAFGLTGENANERNLITGTHDMNVQGMLPFENRVIGYIKDTGNHVLYRVTPVFSGDNLLADGVLMEAYSVEDEGDGICFCVFVFNVQPGIEINYSTGESQLREGYGDGPQESALQESVLQESAIQESAMPESAIQESTDRREPDESGPVEVYVPDASVSYILNTNTHKFHKPDCQSVQDMRAKNRKEFFGTRQEAVEAGYQPCGACRP